MYRLITESKLLNKKVRQTFLDHPFVAVDTIEWGMSHTCNNLLVLSGRLI